MSTGTHGWAEASVRLSGSGTLGHQEATSDPAWHVGSGRMLGVVDKRSCGVVMAWLVARGDRGDGVCSQRCTGSCTSRAEEILR
jgi:hypothetical protein